MNISIDATAKIIIDKTHPKKDGTCSIKLRITYNRKSKFYPTKYSLTIDDFESIISKKTKKKDLNTIGQFLREIESKAEKTIENIYPFTIEKFENIFFNNKTNSNLIRDIYYEVIDSLKKNDQIGTAYNYQCAINSLEKFKKDISFHDISPSFLKKYEKWMLADKKSTTTIGMYLRTLRTIFNGQISEGNINQDSYPFGRNKYEIPTSKNTKKALTISDIQKIIQFQTIDGSTTERSRDYWIFSYFGNGLNFSDILNLKVGNIIDDKVSFIREKTKNTKRDSENIEFFLNDITRHIIEKWGTKSIHPDEYLFPHYNSKMNAETKKKVSRQLISLTNDHMKIIAEKLEIPTSNITTYYARHSFATILMRSGAPISFVSKALGHSDLKTTSNYLGSFEDTQTKEMTSYLMPENLRNNG